MKRRTFGVVGWGAAWLTAASWWVAACGSDSLVGGTCRSGLTECSQRCVDVASDPAHCGACDRVCSSAEACVAGLCALGGGVLVDASEPDTTAGDDASLMDAGSEGSAGFDGAVADRLASDATPSDAGPLCPAPFNTPAHCGTCETQCGADTPLCGLNMGEFKCVAQCEDPLLPCGPLCVDIYSDENNCNGCGIVCPSGICQAGVCVGKGFGHQIVIGMDYTDDELSQSSAQVTLLANAIMVPMRSAVRVLTYDEYAEPSVKARLEAWIGAAAIGRGRSVTFQSAGAWSTIPPQLAVANFDAFLVYDQALAPSTTTANMGTLCSGAMEAFAKGGGVVAVLDGGSPARMIDVINNSGLLTVISHDDVQTKQLKVDAPTDVIGLNLPDVFLARARSVAFVTSQVPDNRRVFVVKDEETGRPVVVHTVP